MASDKSVCDEITARLTPMGPVTGRGMFGGYGIFMEGLMFGLIADNELYFKVDDQNRAAFEAKGSTPFTYQGKSKPIEMSYWKVSSDIFADINMLVEWGSEAFSAAKRAKKKK
jgi:DNA transformation protein and related proteins